MSHVYACNTNGNIGAAGTEGDPYKTLQEAVDNVLVAGGGGTIHPSDLSAFPISAPINWTAFAAANTTSADNPLVWDVWSPGGGSLTISHPYANYPCWELDGDDAVSTLFNTASIPGYVHLVQGKLHSTTGKLVDPPDLWNAYACEMYDAGSGALWDTASYGLITGCYLHTFPANCVGIAVGSHAEIIGNYISAPTGSAISAGANDQIFGNIIRAAAQHGISITGDRTSIRNNTIQGNGSTAYSGVRLTAASEQGVCVGNIIVDFTNGYGINVTPGGNFRQRGYNHFHNNGANENNVVVLGQDLGNNLTTDPGFVDAANGDFRIGLAGKAKGWPRGWPGSATLNFMDTGAAERLEQAMIRLGMNGGMGG